MNSKKMCPGQKSNIKLLIPVQSHVQYNSTTSCVIAFIQQLHNLDLGLIDSNMIETLSCLYNHLFASANLSRNK